MIHSPSCFSNRNRSCNLLGLPCLAVNKKPVTKTRWILVESWSHPRREVGTFLHFQTFWSEILIPRNQLGFLLLQNRSILNFCWLVWGPCSNLWGFGSRHEIQIRFLFRDLCRLSFHSHLPLIPMKCHGAIRIFQQFHGFSWLIICKEGESFVVPFLQQDYTRWGPQVFASRKIECVCFNHCAVATKKLTKTQTSSLLETSHEIDQMDSLEQRIMSSSHSLFCVNVKFASFRWGYVERSQWMHDHCQIN